MKILLYVHVPLVITTTTLPLTHITNVINVRQIVLPATMIQIIVPRVTCYYLLEMIQYQSVPVMMVIMMMAQISFV